MIEGKSGSKKRIFLQKRHARMAATLDHSLCNLEALKQEEDQEGLLRSRSIFGIRVTGEEAVKKK